jgi:hypothetical protein
MKTFLKIFGLACLWFLAWGIFVFYLEPQGIDSLNRYILTAIYFLLLIVMMTAIFKNELDGYVDRFSPKDLLTMVLFSIAVSSIYYFLLILNEGTPLGAIRTSLPAVLQLDYRFIVTKAFDIMFQQTFFMVSIYYLFNNNVSKKIDMFLFGLYTMLIHVPILLANSPMGKIFLFSSFFAGIIFSYCITKSKKGFLYSYMIHFGFYVLLAVVFWLGGEKFIVSLI